MGAFFSSVDDASELGFPGLHVTFGGFGDGNNIQIAASIVNRGTRYCIHAHHYFNTIYDNTIKPHEKVNAQIVKETYTITSYFDPQYNLEEETETKFNRYSLEAQQRKIEEKKSTFETCIDDLSEDFFNVIAEAEGLGIITIKESEDYIEQFDNKYNSLRRDQINIVEKILLMQDFCKELITEISSIKRNNELYE